MAQYANFEGTATGFGTVFGTLVFKNPLSEVGTTSGTCQWAGQAFLDDTTNLGGLGEGTWEQLEGQHKWKINMNVDISDGSKHRSEGEIDLETLSFNGKIFAVD